MAAAKTYRDSSGLTLADYPRPSVAVDTAVLTLIPASGDQPGRLGVLLCRHSPATGGPGWSLPGTFVHPGETLADAVHRSLRAKTGVAGRHAAQLHVFDDPDRDERGWVLSVAHLEVIGPDDLAAARTPAVTRVAPTSARLRLPYDHAAIVAMAVGRLRAEYEVTPDPRGLLGDQFTMSQLRAVHEAVAERALGKDTFRRAMIDRLRPSPTRTSGALGRPATLFRPLQ